MLSSGLGATSTSNALPFVGRRSHPRLPHQCLGFIALPTAAASPALASPCPTISTHRRTNLQAQFPSWQPSLHCAVRGSVACSSVLASSSQQTKHSTQEELQARMQRQVVQVHTLHDVPNVTRPWESGSDAMSSSSAFVLDVERRLLMTTAGAVEAARKVVVCRVGDETEYPAQIVAVCPDADVAILTVGGVRPASHSSHPAPVQRTDQVQDEGHDVEDEEEDDEWVEEDDDDDEEEEEGEEEHGGGAGSGVGGGRARTGRQRPSRTARLQRLHDQFWSGLEGTQWGPLPRLQERVLVAGFPIGGETFCVTSGVVSRCEVLEYSHSKRNLLAMQVDAPLNNGVWGGPVFDLQGRVLAMAFQKHTSQTWMERYDEEGLDALGGGDSFMGDDEADGEQPGRGGDGGGHPGDEDDDDGGENVGYCVPASMLEQVVQDWELSCSTSSTTSTSKPASTSRPAGTRPPTHITPHLAPHASLHTHGRNRSCQVLHGIPVLGLRWQSLEAPHLRAHLGMAPHESGIRVAAVDPSGSGASCLQPGDVITHLGGQAIANDGTVLLRPGQRVLFGYVASFRRVGDLLPAAIIRQGKHMEVALRLISPPALIPSALVFSRPLYFILGGAVLLQFTLPYLYFNEPPRSKGRRLKGWSWGYLGIADVMEWGLASQPAGEQIIIMSELLGGSVAEEGYGGELGKGIRRLKSVNGVPVLNMAHLTQLVVGGGQGAAAGEDDAGSGASGTDGFLRLEFADGSLMVFDGASLRQDTQAALSQQGISHAMSARLRSHMSEVMGAPCTWPQDEDGKSKGGAQKRQQRRRLAIRR